MRWEDILKDWRRPFLNSAYSRILDIQDRLAGEDDTYWLDNYYEVTSIHLKVLRKLIDESNFKEGIKKLKDILHEFEQSGYDFEDIEDIKLELFDE